MDMSDESQVEKEQVASEGRPASVYLTMAFMVVIGIYDLWYGQALNEWFSELPPAAFQLMKLGSLWKVYAPLVLVLGGLMFVSIVLLFIRKSWAWDLAFIALFVDGGSNVLFGIIGTGHGVLPDLIDLPAGVGKVILVIQAAALIGLLVSKEYFNAPYTDYLTAKIEQ